jgi:hypothetical protein
MGNSANFDGNYDKGSMLDPLVLAFRLERFDRSADHPSQSIRYLRRTELAMPPSITVEMAKSARSIW